MFARKILLFSFVALGLLTNSGAVSRGQKRADPKDVSMVQNTWRDKISPIKQSVGLDIFVDFFLQNPDVQVLFTKFTDVNHDRESMKNSPKVKHHANMIMANMETAILNMDKPQKVAELMTNLGMAHAKRKVQQTHVNRLFQIIYKKILTLGLPTEQNKAFKNVLDELSEYMKRGLPA